MLGKLVSVIASDVMSICSWADHLNGVSKHMDQIRRVMMQQEELFKEQVQALHKLYIVQRSAMLDVGKMVQQMASSYKKDSLFYELNYSIVERKLSQESLVGLKDHTKEHFINPLSAFKEVTASNSEISFCSNIKESKVSTSACIEQGKNIDLERSPEEYMDESDYKIKSNNCDVFGSNSCFSLRSVNQVDLQMGCPSFKQSERRPEFSMASEPSQVFGQFRSHIPNRSIHTCSMKCPSGTKGLQDTLNQSMPNILWDCLPAPALSTANPSSDSHVGNALWSSQEAAPLTSENSNCCFDSDSFESGRINLDRKDSEQFKGCFSINVDSMDAFQPCREAEKEPCFWVVTNQRAEDNRNCSGHGSNISLDESEVKLRDKDFSHVASETKCHSDFEQVEAGLDKMEERKVRLEEALHLGNCDSSNASAGSDCQQEGAAELKIAPTCSETKKGADNSEVLKRHEEDDDSESNMEEACESIAAKILLSLSHSKSLSDSNLQLCEVQYEVEPTQSERDGTNNMSTHRRHLKGTPSHHSGAGVDRAAKWTKPMRGKRRTSRIRE